MKKHFLITMIAFCLLSLTNLTGLYAQSGEIIIVNGKRIKLLSDNLISNPGFEKGLSGWTDATASAAQLSSDNFMVVATGGIDNSKYLVGTKNASASAAGSIGTGWSVESGKTYCFFYSVKYLNSNTPAGNETYLKVSLTNDKTASSEPKVVLAEARVNGGGQWTQNSVVFTNSFPSYTNVVARFRWLNNRFGFDNFGLYEAVELVNTEELQLVINEAQALYEPETQGCVNLLSAITKAQSFLSSTSPSDVLKAISELKAAIITYQYANASPSKPLDVTNFIANPSFESGFTGWINNGMATQSNTVFILKNSATYIEKWINRGSRVADASVQQTLANIPNGKYKLTAATVNVQQSASGSIMNNSPTPQTGVSIFAGLKTSGVDTLKNRSIIFTVIDNQVTIGFKAENATGNWIACDNFRLEYQGQHNTSDYADFLNDIVLYAQKLLSQKIQNSARQALEVAITQAQQTISANTLVVEDITLAKQQLETAIDVAKLSIQSYSDLQLTMDYANLVLGWYGDVPQKIESLQSAINTANSILNNYDLTTVEIKQANLTLKNATKNVDKQIHIPIWMMGDVNNTSNNWSYERSKQSKNWILFWEPGYGNNPNNVQVGSYKVNVNSILELAEKSFDFYADSLKFITKGLSKSDTYKMIIRLRYTADWEATGSGVDDRIGLLTLTAWSASALGTTVAHEVGHCFQYQVHCDNNNQNGWMYGFGADASGGNGWWEQCAQWQAFKIFPTQQFTDARFAEYLKTTNKHPLHEAPRYNNFFIQDYWCNLHGMDFIGRLWNESKKPEDPIETYKRITSLTQSQFNDEMYDCATKFTTWDIPSLKSNGASKILTRPQPKMNNAGDNYWMIDSTACVENYGHNIIRLNVPTAATTVYVDFEGKTGINGFRKIFTSNAGWRFGFVALKHDGTRIYSEMKSVSMTENNGNVTLSFDCPANCQYLWFVVTGAPKAHWRHAWDDNDTNDEQWPYRVRFGNSNLFGQPNNPVLATENIEYTSESGDNRIYSIDGKFIGVGTTESLKLKAGIYIRNHKKVFVAR